MTDHALVKWFALANVTDVVITLVFLGFGLGTEFNPYARQLMANGQIVNLLVIKIAYSAVLIGSYALSRSMNSWLEFTTEKSLQIAMVLLWGVQLWNFLNLALAIAA